METLELEFSDFGEEQSEDSCDDWGSEEEADEDFEDLDETNKHKWRKNPPVMKKIPFLGQQQLKIPIPGDGKPMDFFSMFFDDYFFDMIVRETNVYALHALLNGGSLEHRSKIFQWNPTDKDEMLLFLGVSFYMTMVQVPGLRYYWSTDPLFNLPVRHWMSQDRYSLILRCLHFAPTRQDVEESPVDRLYKVKPLVDFFNNKMFTIYSPGKNVCIDEPILLWRGQLFFCQYIEHFEHIYGVKLHLLTEKEGAVLSVDIYKGACDEVGIKGRAKTTVLNLMDKYFDKGHSLYMDKYYNSLSVAGKLLEKNTYCTGKLHKGREDIPRELSTSKLKTGEFNQCYGGNICVGKWRATQDIFYISTEHRNTLEVVKSKSGNKTMKPKPLAQYNWHMPEIEFQEEMHTYYPSHRRNLKWHKKVGFQIFELMLYNSFTLYKYSAPQMSYLDFRMSIVETLLPNTRGREKRKRAKEE